MALFTCWLLLLLVFLFALDYKAIEYLRHGPDILYFDTNGRMLPRPPLSAVGALLAVLVAVQAIVIFSAVSVASAQI